MAPRDACASLCRVPCATIDGAWTSSMPLSSVVVSSFFFFSSRRRHTRFDCDWSSDVCSSDLLAARQILKEVRSAASLIQLGGLPRPVHVAPVPGSRYLAAPAEALRLEPPNTSDRKSVV